jgi:hypothetical protein
MLVREASAALGLQDPHSWDRFVGSTSLRRRARSVLRVSLGPERCRVRPLSRRLGWLRLARFSIVLGGRSRLGLGVILIVRPGLAVGDLTDCAAFGPLAAPPAASAASTRPSFARFANRSDVAFANLGLTRGRLSSFTGRQANRRVGS